MRRLFAAAASYLLILVVPYSTASPLDAAVSALKQQHYQEAWAALLPLANDGNDEAQRLAGEMTFKGQGVKPDVSTAFVWTKLAAQNGNKIAQFNLGYMYEHGEGTKPSMEIALRWYADSGAQGFVLAQRRLGELYDQANNHSAATYWYNLARLNGDTSVMPRYRILASAAQLAADEYTAERREREGAEKKAYDQRQAAEAANRPSFAQLLSTEMGKFQVDFSNQAARVDAASRGTSVSEERQRAADSARYQDILAGSAREKKAAAEQIEQAGRRREAALAAERAAMSLATADQRTKRHAADKADEVRHAHDQRRDEQRDAEAQASAKALHDATERRRQEKIAADAAHRRREKEEADRIAKAKSEADAKERATSDYLAGLRNRTQLRARTCPGAEGKYYVVGIRPRIQPEVVACVDVHYSAQCKGSNERVDGVGANFIGIGTDCFTGDAFGFAKLSCPVGDVSITVQKVVQCR